MVYICWPISGPIRAVTAWLARGYNNKLVVLVLHHWDITLQAHIYPILSYYTTVVWIYVNTINNKRFVQPMHVPSNLRCIGYIYIQDSFYGSICINSSDCDYTDIKPITTFNFNSKYNVFDLPVKLCIMYLAHVLQGATVETLSTSELLIILIMIGK